MNSRIREFIQSVLFSGVIFTSTQRLLGRHSAGSGGGQEIKLGTNLSLDGDTLNASLDIESSSGGNGNDDAGKLVEFPAGGGLFCSDNLTILNTSNSFSASIGVANLTANRSLQAPDEAGTLVVGYKSTGGNGVDDEGKLAVFSDGGGLMAGGFLAIADTNSVTLSAQGIYFERDSGAQQLHLDFAQLTAARTVVLPDASGTVALNGVRTPYSYVVASDFSTPSTSMVNVPGLEFTAEAGGIYSVIGHIITNKNDGTGLRYDFSGPSSPTKVHGRASATTSDALTLASVLTTAFASESAILNSYPGDGYVTSLFMTIHNGSSAGPVRFRIRALGGTAKVYAGSHLMVTRLD